MFDICDWSMPKESASGLSTNFSYRMFEMTPKVDISLVKRCPETVLENCIHNI